MAKYKFTTELSADGIKDLRKWLANYKDNVLQHKVDLLAKTLAENGVNIAQIQVAKLDAIFTGELISSIHTQYGGTNKGVTVFFVVADSEHAAFVEFGTGQLGLEGSYPYPFPEDIDWNYNTGKTIFEIAPGEYGWFYPGEDGKWYFTQGMPSRPFMYETWLELKSTVEKVAKEVFK